jgi:Raf kinase inhibitor-like YbhB/YbcL family protein
VCHFETLAWSLFIMQSHNILLAGLMMSLAVSIVPASVFATEASQLRIKSEAFSDGATIPAPFTCSGANQSPPLSWAGVPVGTKSLALILDDPDAPNGTFVHWVLYDIPPSSSGFAAGIADGKQGVNGAGEAAYMGPCPPPGKPHHYHFRLFALDASLTLGANPDARAVRAGMEGHLKESAELVGIFSR